MLRTPAAIRQNDHRNRGMRCFRLMIATLARQQPAPAPKFAGDVVAGLPARARITVTLACHARRCPTVTSAIPLMSDAADSGTEIGLTGRPSRAIPEPKPRTSHAPA